MIKKFENFITNDECDILIKWLSENVKQKGKINSSEIFSYRQVDHSLVDNLQVWSIMEKYRWKVSQYAFKHFDYEMLYPEYSDLVVWYEGDSMNLHADNFDCSGNKPFLDDLYFRKISCLIYLNDNFEGGQTFFENGEFINPKKGMLAIFPSDCEHKHGVSKITNGIRYTMPMWLTDLNDIYLNRIKNYYIFKK
jgi:hypothetical protein